MKQEHLNRDILSILDDEKKKYFKRKASVRKFKAIASFVLLSLIIFLICTYYLLRMMEENNLVDSL